MTGMENVLKAHVVITDGLYEPSGWCATCGNLDDGDQERHQAEALSAAGFGNQHDAWEDGYKSGHSRAMRMMSDEPNVQPGTNPYPKVSET